MEDLKFQVCDDSTNNDEMFPSGCSQGLVARSYASHPPGCYANIQAAPTAPAEMKLMTDSEIVDLIRYKKEIGATNRQIRRKRGPNGGIIPSHDQDGIGYCWCHSPVTGIEFLRACMNQPWIRLSPFMIGSIMKGYQDRGGWGADAVQFITEHGVPTVQYWKYQSMSRSNDTPEMRANAKLHLIKEGWVDYQMPVWDRTLAYQYHKTILALGGVVVADRNKWSHSTLDYDLEIVDGVPWPVTWNQWTDNWKEMGEAVMMGSWARIDGGVGIMTTTPSIN